MNMYFTELNADQRRETVNTRQRFQAFMGARARSRGYRGSMVWSTTRGRDYLMRVGYDRSGHRKQTSLGPRNEDTEAKKAEFERRREDARNSLATIQGLLAKQASVNKVIGLGRVPHLSARIIRAIDDAGLMGAGVRVLGTHALYAYEAAAGVQVESGLTATGDVDLLLDARQRLSFVASAGTEQTSLLRLLQRVDKSFARAKQPFRATNDEGYLVELIKPLRDPPWTKESAAIGNDPEDLAAVEIAGLAWHESAPAFESIAIDEKGIPLRIVTSDPRVFAVHKLWVSQRNDREAVKKVRDRQQAECVASLLAEHLTHLAFSQEELLMLPRSVVEAAKPMFEKAARFSQ